MDGFDLPRSVSLIKLVYTKPLLILNMCDLLTDSFGLLGPDQGINEILIRTLKLASYAPVSGLVGVEVP